jgi:hypothetical protein
LPPILSAIIGEKDCPRDVEFRAASTEGRRKVLTMISTWDEVDNQLIIEGLPRAEKIMTSDRTETYIKPFHRRGLIC